MSIGCSSSGVSSTLGFFHDIFASPKAHRQETSCPWIEAMSNRTKTRLPPLSYFCWVVCSSNKQSHTRISQECKAGTLTEEGELAVAKGDTVHRLSRERRVHGTLAWRSSQKRLFWSRLSSLWNTSLAEGVDTEGGCGRVSCRRVQDTGRKTSEGNAIHLEGSMRLYVMVCFLWLFSK